MKLRKLIMGVLVAVLWLQVAGYSRAAVVFNNEGDEKKTESSEPARDTKAATNTAAPTTEEQIRTLNDKVRRLEEMIERQQQIIEALQPRAVAATAVDAAATPVAAVGVAPAATQAAAAPADETTKKLDSLYKAFGNINISGDLRFRYDGQFNQGFDAPVEAPDRNRVRIRARLGLTGSFHKNFDYGFRVSTGGFTNSTSANATFGDFFNRKAFELDRAFLRYDTKTSPYGLSLIAGKFDYPWKRTELTFDSDLNPEGAAETLYVKGKNAFKELRIIAFQLPIVEVGGGKDSALFGGQLQSTVGMGNWNFTGAATFLNFNQADLIARGTGRPGTQVGGGTELNFTNRLRRDAAGNILGFVANYNILDVIGEISYNGFKKYPIVLLFDYARNMSDRLERLKERNAYWVEFKVGRLKEKGDVEFTYTFDRVQQDAILSIFSFDDFLGTNSRNNRVTFGYTVNNNFFIQAIGLFNERFNTLPGRDSRISKRIQIDFNYRF